MLLINLLKGGLHVMDQFAKISHVMQFYQAFLPYMLPMVFIHMWLPSNVNRYILDNRDDARAVSARILCRANYFNPSSLSKLVSQARRFHNCRF